MPYNKIIIWGLRKKWHTHRFIHKAFYANAKKLGYPVIWVEDEKENNQHIEHGDLVIYSEVFGKMVPKKRSLNDYHLEVKDGVFYCLHGVQEMFHSKIDSRHLLLLEKYQNDFDNMEGNEVWRPAVLFNHRLRTLYQPWGTDLLSHEFKKPVFRRFSPFVFWVGSVWNNTYNQGNISAIESFKQILARHHLTLVKVRFVPDWMNVFFICLSRIAPAIVGDWQKDHDYLPCRMFKNISYGHVGFTNVQKFKELLGDAFVGGTIAEMVDTVMKLSKDEYKDLVKRQQDCIRLYTYKDALENIFRAFDKINQD